MTKFDELMEKIHSIIKEKREGAEYITLLTEAMRYASPEIKRLVEAKLKELGLIPESSFVDDTGQIFFTRESIAKLHGVSVEEVNQLCAELEKNHPEHFAPRGELHRIQ